MLPAAATRTLFGACIIAAAAGLSAGFDQAQEVEQAKQAISVFGAELKSELMSAMKAGGTVNAISVCNTSAMDISAEISREKNMNLSRVSLKNRNPANAANNWQSKVLLSFEKRQAQGEDPQSLAWQEITETDQGTEFRFMKAIPTGGLCLQCHGATLAPEVSEKLADLYPQDKATGYREGDIRGAFVVTRLLD